MWDFRRQGWTFRSGGPGSGLFKSTDGGDHWSEISPAGSQGLPEKPYGRIALAVAPSKANVVYAMIESKQSALYRSDDGGENWHVQDADPRIWGRDGDLTAYLVTIMVGAAIAIAAARPVWIQHPALYSRYLLPVLPFLLLFLAEGIVATLEPARAAAPVRAIAVAVIAAALCWFGPIPSYFYYPNQFMGHLRFQFDYDPAHNPYVQLIPREPVPEFYRMLAQRPPASLTLIEAPWRLESNFNPHPWYQEIHRQKVKIGLTTPVCGVRTFGEYPANVTGLRLHQFAHLSNILAGKTYGADYLVMHLAPWKTPPDATVEWPDVAACLPTIESALGQPVYRDAQIVVFDLRRK